MASFNFCLCFLKMKSSGHLVHHRTQLWPPPYGGAGLLCLGPKSPYSTDQGVQHMKLSQWSPHIPTPTTVCTSISPTWYDLGKAGTCLLGVWSWSHIHCLAMPHLEHIRLWMHGSHCSICHSAQHTPQELKWGSYAGWGDYRVWREDPVLCCMQEVCISW